MSLLYEELTYELNGYFFEVHNDLGTGYDEESYHLFLEQKLKANNIPFQSKSVRYIEHRGKKIHKFIADLIIEDKVIIELKSIQKDFHAANYLQILSYLKCWQKELGILVNFGLPKTNRKRVIYTPKEPDLIEDYKYIQDLVNPNNRILLRQIREAILTIFQIHGVGYEASIYESLIMEELSFQNLEFKPETFIPIEFEGKLLRKYELKMPIIGNQIICGVVAMKEDITCDIIKVQTYLNALNLPIGLLVHFGKENLEIYGVRP